MKKLIISIITIIFLLSTPISQAETIIVTSYTDVNRPDVNVGFATTSFASIFAVDQLPNANLFGYSTIAELHDALIAGNIHVLVDNAGNNLEFIALDTRYSVLDTFSEDKLGIGVDDGEVDLLQALNAALSEIINDKVAYTAMYNTWFTTSPLIYEANDLLNYSYPDPLTSTGDLANILSAGVMEFGMDPTYPPFEWFNGEGYEGFDIDLMNEIVNKLSIAFNQTITAQVVSSAWDPIISNLINGEFDVILSAMTITESRELTIDFTIGYWLDFLSLVGPASGQIDGLTLTTTDPNTSTTVITTTVTETLHETRTDVFETTITDTTFITETVTDSKSEAPLPFAFLLPVAFIALLRIRKQARK